MRPSGVMKVMNAAAITHQLIVTSHGTPNSAAATLLIKASQVTHCRPVSVASGTVSRTCVSRVNSGVGATTRGVTATGVGFFLSRSSRKPASEPSRGWS